MEQTRLTLWLAFVIALVTSIAPTILALAAYRQSAETHDVVNSRMTEMIKLVKTASGDAATLAEKKAQHQREGGDHDGVQQKYFDSWKKGTR